MTIKKGKVDAWLCRCERCGHAWTSLADEPPARCPGCKQLRWNQPAAFHRDGVRGPKKK